MAQTTRQMALGVSMDPAGDMDRLDQFIADSGRNPAIYSIWNSWGSGCCKLFPRAVLDQVQERATPSQPITPMIIWQPVDGSNLDSPAYTYRKIIKGNHDAYIRAWARAAKDYGKPLLLRFAHEMNGIWFPWSTQRFDNTPTRFILAYQRIWNIFKGPNGVGATNVKFLWSPNQPCPNCDTLASVWPGKKYVDYAGLSSFNWSTPQAWKSMVATFAPAMNAIAALTSKPVIVTETASVAVGGDKVAWITNGYPAVYEKWPQLKAVVYFNVDTRFMGQRDWRLTIPDRSPLDAYTAILADPRFQGTVP
jgi:beta-mannanase